MRKDIKTLTEMYAKALSDEGPTLAGLGWPNSADLARRFESLLRPLSLTKKSGRDRIRLLDLGCGPGMLLDYLKENKLLDQIDYLGVDVFEATLSEARARWPGYKFELRDVRDHPFDPNVFDYCLICGAFSVRYHLGYDDMKAMVEETLRALWPSVRIGLGFTVMSKHVDWERDGLFHWPLDDIMAFCKANLSRHVALHVDYGLWETSALVFKAPRAQLGKVPADWIGKASQEFRGKAQKALSENSAKGTVTGCPTFDYAKGRPNLFLMMRYKQALVAALGIERAFAVYSHTVALPDSEQIVSMPLLSERTFAETQSAVFVEVSGGGQQFTLKPPPVIGKGNQRPLKGTARSFYIACFEAACIRGRSALIEVKGVALLDYQRGERDRIDDEIEWDPAIFHPNLDADGKVWVVTPRFPTASTEINEAFTLVGTHTDFFGHWMWEYLPKYVAARLSGSLPSLPVLIDADMPEQHRESLQLLFGPDIEIIEVPAFATVRVRRLWCVPSLMYMPLHEKRNERFSWDVVAASPERFAPVIREMARRIDHALGKIAGSAKLFLARRQFRHRYLVNAIDIEAIAISQGFDIVYPEDLSFREQASLIRAADFIIAPEGSAIFLMSLATAGTNLCILNHPFTDGLAIYQGLFSMHGVRITVMTGPVVREHAQTPNDSDYKIDEGQFRAFLSDWLDS